MTKNNKHIKIVRSNVKGLSSMSQKSSQAASKALSKYFSNVTEMNVDSIADLVLLTDQRPDLVFLGMEFIASNLKLGVDDPDKIWITNYLDDHGIAYTGSSQLAHIAARDKALAKQCAIEANLKTSRYQIVDANDAINQDTIRLSYPLFVKPSNRGGGAGIDGDSIVHNLSQLQTKVQSIRTDFQAAALIEEYLPGREFSVAILRDQSSDKYNVMPIELVAPIDRRGNRILGSQVKSSNTEHAMAVADLPIKHGVSKLALDVFSALKGRDYGRIDVRLDAQGTPHFLEANLIPSLIDGYGSFPKACNLNLGIEYDEMMVRIANLGLNRSRQNTLTVDIK